ncbi:MAG: nicotinamidase [Desulfuromonadales bacterium]
MKKDAALLIVDVQNDFCPDGALAIPGGDRVVEPLNRIAERFAAAGLPVIATRDWHPAVTGHFREFGGTWPPHCVQGSPGAGFHPSLRLPEKTIVVSKGHDPDKDSYSAFDGESADGVSLGEILVTLHVRHLYVGGLATDFCIRSSAVDARKTGLEVTVLTDAIAGVDLTEGDSDRALDEMGNAGVNFNTADESILLVT